MNKEDLLTSFEIIIKGNPKDVSTAADLIWELWMNHPTYAIVAGKILNKETGEEFGK